MTVHNGRAIVSHRSCVRLINDPLNNQASMMAKVLLIMILTLGASYPFITAVAAQNQVSPASTQSLVVSLQAGIRAALTVPGQPSIYYSSLHNASSQLLLAQNDLAVGNTSGAAVEIGLAMILTGMIAEQNTTPVAESPGIAAAIVGNYTSRLSYMIQGINDSAIRDTAGGRLDDIMANISIITHSKNISPSAYSEVYEQLDELNTYILQNYSLPQFSNEFQLEYSTHYQGYINSKIHNAESHGNSSLSDELGAFNDTINSIVGNLTSTNSLNGYMHDYNQYYKQIENFNYTLHDDFSSGSRSPGST